jgi:hypothetical protein
MSSYNVSRFIIIKEDSEAIERCPWSNLQAEASFFCPLWEKKDYQSMNRVYIFLQMDPKTRLSSRNLN